jgi:glycosyltransferase involved in cell wall biosynthesis
MRKKRILFNSNYSRMYTGFGKNTKNLLTYLEKTGKYTVIEYASQMVDGHPDLQTLPWKARASLPNNQQAINELNADQNKARLAAYGEYNIEKVVSEEKPDLIIHAEDFWGVSWTKDKNYFKKIPTVIWVTHDSLPLIGLKETNQYPHYWTWSDFARKDFHKNGFTHVKTQYPPINLSHFYNIGSAKKKEIRNKFKIKEDAFIVLDVFRNQLRKLQPNLIEGFSQFKKDHPESNAILLLATSFSEGWNIPDLCNQYGVNQKDIWAVYVSSESNEYLLHPFIGQEQKCPFTGKEKALNTINIAKGVTEEQLNEIYNIADVFCHPASSGATEIPTVEAAAAEKIILTADYSYGEDIIELNKGALCLDWAKYTEIGTQFIKSSPFPSSITKQIKKVYNMDAAKRAEMGKLNRLWAKENYDLELNCKKIEEYIDSLPYVDWDNIKLDSPPKNENFQLPPNYKEISVDEFINLLYKEVLIGKPDPQGYKNWETQLNNGAPREKIYEYFINVARSDNAKTVKHDIWDIIDKERPEKRALMVCRESIGDIIICSSLFESFHEQYPNHLLYFMCEEKYFEVLHDCPLVHKLIPYIPALENELSVIGAGQKNALFDVFLFPTIPTQKILGYLGQTNPVIL